MECLLVHLRQQHGDGAHHQDPWDHGHSMVFLEDRKAILHHVGLREKVVPHPSHLYPHLVIMGRVATHHRHTKADMMRATMEDKEMQDAAVAAVIANGDTMIAVMATDTEGTTREGEAMTIQGLMTGVTTTAESNCLKLNSN